MLFPDSVVSMTVLNRPPEVLLVIVPLITIVERLIVEPFENVEMAADP